MLKCLFLTARELKLFPFFNITEHSAHFSAIFLFSFSVRLNFQPISRVNLDFKEYYLENESNLASPVKPRDESRSLESESGLSL